MDCSLPGSSVHEILQARILEGIAISFSKSKVVTHSNWLRIKPTSGLIWTCLSRGYRKLSPLWDVIPPDNFRPIVRPSHKEMHIELDGKSVIMICLADLFGGFRRPSEFEASIENWVVTRKLCNHFNMKIKNLEGCYVLYGVLLLYRSEMLKTQDRNLYPWVYYHFFYMCKNSIHKRSA